MELYNIADYKRNKICITDLISDNDSIFNIIKANKKIKEHLPNRRSTKNQGIHTNSFQKLNYIHEKDDWNPEGAA